MRTLEGIEDGSLIPEPQPRDGVSLAPKVTVEDARVDWTKPALAIDRLIRGCTPAPGPWTTFRGERLKLGPVELVDGAGGADTADHADAVVLHPGVLAVSKQEVLVGTGSGVALRLTQVQPSGKKMMAVRDWLNGAKPATGERFA